LTDGQRSLTLCGVALKARQERLRELARAASVAAFLAVCVRAGAAPPEEAGGGLVRLRDEQVLVLRVGRAGESLAARARAASRALEQASEDSPTAVARVEIIGDTASVHVGRLAVLEVGPEDVAAERAASLEALAQAHASRIDRALQAERRRARLSAWVFDFSLLVFSGLVTFLLLGKIAELERRAGAWMRKRPGRVPALTLHRVELVSSDAMAGALGIVLRIGRYLLQLAIGYAWLVFGLSLFPVTRGAGLTLGRLVLGPATSLVSRLGSSLPALLGALIAGTALWLALRALRLFFQSVADGGTHVAWLPPDIAVPVGELLRVALVVLAAVFAAPVLTGSEQGTLAQFGTAALAVVALGAAPAMANVAAGLPRLLRRTYRTGHRAEIAGRTGVVRGVDLLHVEIEDAGGARVLVPHLATLLAPTRLVPEGAPPSFELAIDPAEDPARVHALVVEAGGPTARAELLRIDADAAVYRVSGSRPDLPLRLADAVRASGVRLGRRGRDLAPGAP